MFCNCFTGLKRGRPNFWKTSSIKAQYTKPEKRSTQSTSKQSNFFKFKYKWVCPLSYKELRYRFWPAAHCRSLTHTPFLPSFLPWERGWSEARGYDKKWLSLQEQHNVILLSDLKVWPKPEDITPNNLKKQNDTGWFILNCVIYCGEISNPLPINVQIWLKIAWNYN